MLLRGLDSMARRYGMRPSRVVPSALAGLDPAASEWADLLLMWACVANADEQLRHAVLTMNQRGDMVFPTIPLTSWPM